MQLTKEINTLRRIFLLLLVSLTIMTGSALIYIYKDTKRDQISDLSNTVHVIKSYYELSFHQWELTLLSVGNRLSEIADAEERICYANAALKIYEDQLLVFGFSDTTGRVLTYARGNAKDTLLNFKDYAATRRSFELALSKEGATVGESYYFSNDLDWILPIRVPIRNEFGDILAVSSFGVNYSTLIAELEAFGFNKSYQIHLKNLDFNTTQLFYPLDEKSYASTLGSDAINYVQLDTVGTFKGVQILSGIDPFSGDENLMASAYIEPMNHQLIVSIPKRLIYESVCNWYSVGFILYLLLLVCSFILYRYLKVSLKKSLIRLKVEQANLKSIFESTSNIIGLFDKNKKLLEYNSAFNETSKMTDDLELSKGMNIISSMKNEEAQTLFSSFMDRTLAGNKVQEEIVYPGPNGDLVFQFNYNPVYDDKKVVGFALFAEDITEIRSYQKQLEEYNKGLENKVEERTAELEEKNEELHAGYKKLQATQQQLIRAEKMASLGILAAGIGHEINNPLNFIKHGAISLKNQLSKDQNKDYSDYFQAIEEGVRRASAIVTGLSHFSRIGDAMNEHFEIHQVLDNSLILLRNRLKSKNIEIKKSYKAAKNTVLGNEGKLHQVFTNIINNAEQAIADKGEIGIYTRNESNKIIVEITDTGSGISKSVIGKIMDPFFTTKDPGEGTGLGLFVCQMIMDEHHADMQVSSRDGVGTSFVLTFDLQSDKSQ